jgi:hypothetical protein
MKKVIFCIAVLATTLNLWGTEVKDVNISVVLDATGSALITEQWNVVSYHGTEWYLKEGNLGKIKVTALSVTDETGRKYVNEGAWDVDRTLEEKAFRCGIVDKGDEGIEICWGLSSYGEHKYTVRYNMSNFVKGFNDYNAFNHMFVARGLSDAPEHVKVNIVLIDKDRKQIRLNKSDAKLWGFGFDGNVTISDGSIVAETNKKLDSENSIIIMARFNKGLMEPANKEDAVFYSMEKQALEDSDDGEDLSTIDLIRILVPILILISCGIFAAVFQRRYSKQKIFGTADKIKGWIQNIPFEGNLPAAYYVLKKTHHLKEEYSIVGAYLFRWIRSGTIVPQLMEKGKETQLSFEKESGREAFDSEVEYQLYQMLREASGSDLILQPDEVEKWVTKKYKRAEEWIEDVEKCGAQFFVDKGFATLKTPGSTKLEFKLQGKMEARTVIEFENYLQGDSWTKMGELGICDKYLSYAALYGISDTVVKSIQNFYPSYFAENSNSGFNPSLLSVLLYSSYFRDGYAMGGISSSNGNVSIGGGGGFSGGGFGGGCR